MIVHLELSFSPLPSSPARLFLCRQCPSYLGTRLHPSHPPPPPFTCSPSTSHILCRCCLQPMPDRRLCTDHSIPPLQCQYHSTRVVMCMHVCMYVCTYACMYVNFDFTTTVRALFSIFIEKRLLRWDSNPRPAFKAVALPTEPPRQRSWLSHKLG